MRGELTVIKRKNRKLSLTYESRNTLWGVIFLLPWIIGTLLFFVYPVIESFALVFCDVKFAPSGMVRKFTGLENIKTVFFEDVFPLQCIANALKNIGINLVIVMAISILIALLLNQKFKGRALARTAFALPVIIGTGILIKIFRGDLFVQAGNLANATGTVFQGDAISQILLQAGLPLTVIESIVGIVNSVVDLIWKCGVEILLFLSGLQAIPSYLYEVCDIDGATSWQKFWLITFPLMTPFILLNAIYIIIDTATYYDNHVMLEVGWKFDALMYGYANTLSFAYCIVVGIVVAIVGGLISRHVTYMD